MYVLQRGIDDHVHVHQLCTVFSFCVMFNDASAAAEDGDGSSGSEVLSCSPTTTSRVVGGKRGLVTIRASDNGSGRQWQGP
jgi:hypothetical protein